MPKMEIRPHCSAPTLFMDGKPVFFAALWTWQAKKYPWTHKKEISYMREAGVRIYSWFDKWPEPPTDGRYDFAPHLRNIEEALDEDPEGYILLKPDVDAPQWWQERHPDELEKVAVPPGMCSGRPIQSYASKRWQQDAVDMLGQMVSVIKSQRWGERVIAILPCAGGSGEWMQDTTVYPGDYSEPMQRHFRAWLKRKYGAAARLQEAWGADGVDFDTAAVPTPERWERQGHSVFRDPAVFRDVVDYLECTDELVAECVEMVCRAVVETAQGTMFSGTYFDKSMEAYWPTGYWSTREDAPRDWSMIRRSGNGGVMRLLQSPWVQVLASPYSYVFRSVGGTCDYMQIAESGKLHGKLIIVEDDARTPAAPIPAGEYGKPADADETVQQLVRNFGIILTRSSALWWGYPWTPDAEHGAWSDPRIRGCVKTLAQLGRFNVECVADRGPAAEIAVVVDTDSEHYLACDYTLAWSCVVRQRIWELSRMGAPHDLYHLDDLVAGRLRPYKMVIFLQAYATDDERTRAIHDYLGRCGATAVWLYAAGCVNRSGERGKQALSLESASALTGIKVQSYPVAWAPVVTITHYGHPITERLPEHTSYTAAAPYGPILCCADTEATTLGTIVHIMGKCEPGLVVKRNSSWQSVWSAVPYLPAKLLREIARWSGVHIWCERDEVMAANNDWLVLHSLKGGEIEISLPRAADVVDALSGESLAPQANRFTARLRPRSSALYYHGAAPWRTE